MRLTPTQKRAIDRAIDLGLAITKKDMEDPELLPDFMVILPFEPKLLSRIFTKERLRLWAELHRSSPKSLTALARKLGRNVSRVRQDVLILEGAHLLRTEKRGNLVRAVAEAPHILVASPA